MTRPAPGYATPSAPATAEACTRCREPVHAAHPDGFWMIDGEPRHTRCVDWASRPFPYAWAVEAGERALRRVGREGPPDATLVRAVAWLRRASSRWRSAKHAALLASAARAAAVVSGASGPSATATRDAAPATLGGGRRRGH